MTPSILQTRKGAATELAERLQTVNAARRYRLSFHRTLWCVHTALNAQPRWVNNRDKKAHGPSSLAGINSHLASQFELLGCTRDWDLATQCTACRLEACWQANQVMLHTEGMRGAVPLTEAELHLLQSSMYMHSKLT